MSTFVRRINLFGGPGSGKSTLAAHLFSELKTRGVSVELVQEHVKTWAYEKREITAFDQVFLFAEQLRREHSFLANGVRFVITDSPLLLSLCYAERVGLKSWKSLLEVSDDFDVVYPAFNIFVERDMSVYEASGRYETPEQAMTVDQQLLNVMDVEFVPYVKVKTTEREQALERVLRVIRS